MSLITADVYSLNFINFAIMLRFLKLKEAQVLMHYVLRLRGQFFCIKKLKAHNNFTSFHVGKIDLQKQLTESFPEVNRIVFFICIAFFFV